MSKRKTHSGAKKRFSLTGTKKVKCSQAGKSHFMRNKSNKQLRNLRGVTVLADCDAHRIKKKFL